MTALVYAAFPSLTLWQPLSGEVQEAQSITELVTFTATQLPSAIL